jgi:hypothetical protein
LEPNLKVSTLIALYLSTPWPCSLILGYPEKNLPGTNNPAYFAEMKLEKNINKRTWIVTHKTPYKLLRLIMLMGVLYYQSKQVFKASFL